MDPTLLQTGFAALAALALTLLALRPGRRSTAGGLISALLVAVVLWSAGLAIQRHAASDETIHFGFTLATLGALCVPPLWFLVAARYNRITVFEERTGVAMALVVPSALAALAVVTNPGHRLFVHDLRLDTLPLGPFYWGGTLYWLSVAWSVGLVLATVVLFLGSALRRVSRPERLRGALLALVPATPAAVHLLHTFGFAFVGWDPTPAVAVCAVGTVFGVNLRTRFLETLPIARRDVIQHLADGVILADGDGRVLDLNPAAHAMLQRVADPGPFQTVDAALRALAGPDGELAARISDLLGGGQPTAHQFESAGGRLLELDAVPVAGAEGRLSGLAVILRDRTEQRQAESFLRQSQRLETMAGLTAGVAHEINDPLAFVRANLGHLQRVAAVVAEKSEQLDSETAPELSELRVVVAETLEGVDRIGAAVARMQRFARLESDEITRVDVNEVVLDAVRMAGLHGGQHVRVETDLRRPIPPVQGSPERLVQAVLNLVVNAKQALPSGPGAGHVRVETRSDVQQVEIRVIDDGHGVPEELRERIFAPFFTTRAGQGGAGLGLSISFDIVREHGGLLELEPSEKGAVFVIQLPTRASSLRASLLLDGRESG